MSRKRKITFVVGNRAHFARIQSIIRYLKPEEYRVIVFEAAAVREYGNVLSEIKDKCKNVSVLYTNISGSNLITMTKSTGMAIIDLSIELSREKPEVVVVIADRYESLAAAIAARYMNISLAHVQGGEVTGSIDDSVRHAITKLANLHFVSNKDCGKRVMKMGEKKGTVFVTGCPTIDLCSELPHKDVNSLFCLPSKGDYEKNFFLKDKYIVVAYHPITTENDPKKNEDNFSTLLNAINDLNVQTVWMYPNIDAERGRLMKKIIQFKIFDRKGNIHFFKHFDAKDYLLLVNNAVCIVGNSSVGIRESSFLGVPSVNVGYRQIGRTKCLNVIDCKVEKTKIKLAVLKQIKHGKYKPNHYYGDGFAGKRIAEVLKKNKLDYNKVMSYWFVLDHKDFVNNYHKRPLLVSRGKGVFLYSNRGKKYIDFLSGISINNFGYSNTQLIKILRKQIGSIIHPSNYYFTKPQIELAKMLKRISHLDRVFLSNSGAEANEAALVFIRRYYEKTRPDKNEIITFEGSFVGRTYGCRSLVSGTHYENLRIRRVPFNNTHAFLRLFSDKTLAIHLELVLGHGGVKVLNKKLVSIIQKQCDRTGALIFVDEVQTGLGRALAPLACDLYNLKPDIITLAKSLGGGFPLAATLVSERIASIIKPGDHGSTMGGNTVACVAGCKIVEYISKKGNIEKMKKIADIFYDELSLLKSKFSNIIEVRFFGLMFGVELVDKAREIADECFKCGLLLDVVSQQTLRLLPPFIISKEEISYGIKILERAIRKYERA